jgi:uncharacterized protein (TIGR02271 family)
MVERFRGRVAEGMQVKSSDGEKLGKVVACQATGFVVEKGFLFPKDLLVPYDRISNIQNGEILIAIARADLGEGGVARAAAPATGGVMEDIKGAGKSIKEAATSAVSEARAALGAEPAAKNGARDEFGKPSDIRMDLVEEEIITTKHVERVGEVHVRKEVITEEKQVTIPVTREVIRVERVAVNHDVRTGDRVFEKESYDIPVSEEHIDVEKRPVVREEIHIGKEIQRGEETASATVRRERAEIETMGPVRRAEAPSNDQLRATGTGGARR